MQNLWLIISLIFLCTAGAQTPVLHKTDSILYLGKYKTALKYMETFLKEKTRTTILMPKRRIKK